MKLTTIQIVCALLGGIALVFAFMAAGVAAASALLGMLIVAAVVWVGWRAVRHRFSHARDRTA